MEYTLSIKERLRLHKIWVKNDLYGARLVEHGDALKGANLSGEDLSMADLKRANLKGADLKRADIRGADLRGASLFDADLKRADLRLADLRGADLRLARIDGAQLRSANLTGCNVDYSAWPLWCGSKGVIIDERIFRQLVDHLLVVVVPDSEEARKVQEWLLANAGRSHYARKLGLADEKEG